jgi:hypothetical protein
MLFFQNIPNIFYNLSENPTFRPIVVKNILASLKIREALKKPSLIYYTYLIKDNDTPEIIADKYYDSPNRHWIVLLYNNIIDPQYDWPMSYDVFKKYLTNKYGSVETAQTTVHNYNKIITKVDSFTGFSNEKIYQIDAETYASLPVTNNEIINLTGGGTVTITTTKESVSKYSYEETLNENKRVIKILDKIYVNMLEQEFNSFYG